MTPTAALALTTALCAVNRKEKKVTDETEADRIKRNRERFEQQDAELLALCGLTTADFCRFRSVFREGDTLFVSTRENGVDGISVDAIRNPNFKSRTNNDFDSTYADYEFTIPALGAPHE